MKKNFFILLICLFANYNNVFSQNIEFDKIISLQKSNKEDFKNFFLQNGWQKDKKNNNLWLFGNANADSADALFVLRNDNCIQNIIYYKLNDSMHYNKLKNNALLISEKNKHYNYTTTDINDYTLDSLFVRFYETHDSDQIPLYSIWVFSKDDSWFFGDINKICFPKSEISNLKNPEPVFTVTETPPDFPGGDMERIRYLQENIKYPTMARESGIQGTVYVSFIIETNGSITNIKIMRGIGGGCDEEVISLIKKMPYWKPGTQNGKPVRVQFNMPVKFTLAEINY